MDVIPFLPRVFFPNLNSIANLLKWKKSSGGCQGRGNDRVSDLRDYETDQGFWDSEYVMNLTKE